MTPEDFTKIRAMIREELAAERLFSANAVWSHQLTNRVTEAKAAAGTLLSFTHEDASRIPKAAEVPADPKA